MRLLLNLFLSVVLSVLVSIGTVFVLKNHVLTEESKVLSVEATPIPTPLSRYMIQTLQETNFESEEIKLDEILDEAKNYTSYLFNHSFKPNFEAEKQVTGMLNIPNEDKKYPLVILLRGYVDKEIYSTGMGTNSVSKFFANNNFITIAPDFLGYGDSSGEALNIYESRFQTYTTLLSIYNSLESIQQWDGENVYIWAHSNGGQIALTFLAATEEEIPTVLWAPVTKQFPYSVLYFTDELDDNGKYIRRELAKLEEVYDIDKFSFTNYLENIQAIIQLHQGGLDDAVPTDWSTEFVEELEELEKEIEYLYYPNSDHNLRQDWDKAMQRSLEFFSIDKQ